jgi:hypothetical protein
MKEPTKRTISLDYICMKVASMDESSEDMPGSLKFFKIFPVTF